MPCLWCDEPLAGGRRGSPKVVCSSICRGRFHTASRRWAEREVRSGRLSVADIRKEAPKACTLSTGGKNTRALAPPVPDDIARYRAALTIAREIVMRIPISPAGVAELCAYGWLD